MERRESDREEGWGIRRTIYPGGGGLGRMLSVLLQPLWAWHGGRKLSCCGWMPLWPDPFCVPPILTWESFCGKSPNGFYVSDLCPQNIGWHSPHLPKKKKKKERPSPIQVADTLGAVSSGAFGTHQRVTLASIPQLPPEQLPFGWGSLWERRSEGGGGLGWGGKRLQVPEQATKMSRSGCRLEKNFQTWDNTGLVFQFLHSKTLLGFICSSLFG